MDNGSTKWIDGLVEITLAINTQKHLTINYAPAELLFRDCNTYINWLDSQKRKDLTIGVLQEDLNQPSIFESDIEPKLPINPQLLSLSNSRVNIDIQSQSHSQIIMHISLESGLEINVRITSPIRDSPEQWYDTEANIQTSIEVDSPMTTTTATATIATATATIATATATIATATTTMATATTITTVATATTATTSTTATTIQSTDPVIQKAQQSTQKARVRMVEKYLKKHDIQHFDIGDIVSIKVPREDRTVTDNRRLFGRILDEPHSHRYKVITQSGIINRLMPTKDLRVVDKSLWPDITILESTKQITLTLATREASTSQRIRISCQCKGQYSTKRYRCFKEGKDCTVHCHKDEHDCGRLSRLAICTEQALIEPESSNSRRKRARADTVSNVVSLTGLGVAVDLD
ncbi:hypothetical protein B7463_g9535, partial [Scytalidium lignicola]